MIKLASRIPRSAGSRTVVLMCDNRPLETKRSTASYHSLAAFINAVYCRRQGYDFLYLQPRLGFWHSLSVKTRARSISIPDDRWKQKACCYNYALEQYRAAPWAKLPSLKRALELNYDMVVYVDTDCVFADQNTSIETFIERTPVQIGAPFRESCLGFLKNTPWGDDLPCSGFIVAKNCPETASFLKKWWNFPNAEKNFDHTYEQSSLHEIFADNINQLCVWDSIFFLEKEGQFLRHVLNEHRKPYLSRFANQLEAGKELSFDAVMRDVKAQNLVCLKTSSVRWI